jgi:rare lipoprotein A
MRRSAPALPTSCRTAGWVALALATSIAGCAGTGNVSERTHRPAAPVSASLERDGPGDIPPSELAARPDAEPRLETMRSGGANKPYQLFGRDYVPVTGDPPFVERGLASWYGRKFHGRPTAIGETYDMYAMSAAHPTLPLPSYARIRNPANGREIVVRVNDRGPFHHGRIVDLSYAAAAKLGLLRGVAPVELERITYADIRAGTWRRHGDAPTRLAAAEPASEPAAATVAAGAPAAPSGPAASGGHVPALAWVGAVSSDVATAAPAAAREVDPGLADAPARGFWVQLGAFRDRSGAEGLQRRLVEGGHGLPGLVTAADAALYRVQAGPYASGERARDAAQRIRDALGIVPLIVERR